MDLVMEIGCDWINGYNRWWQWWCCFDGGNRKREEGEEIETLNTPGIGCVIQRRAKLCWDATPLRKWSARLPSGLLLPTSKCSKGSSQRGLILVLNFAGAFLAFRCLAHDFALLALVATRNPETPQTPDQRRIRESWEPLSLTYPIWLFVLL